MDRAPQHAARPTLGRARRAGAIVGALAATAALTVGAMALNRPETAVVSTLTSAREITTQPPVPIPLSADELLDLLDAPPDYGPLTDTRRRASCLAGLGYPATADVLGARQVQMHGRIAVVLLLGGEDPATVTAIAVPAGCSAVDTGLLAQTTVKRP